MKFLLGLLPPRGRPIRLSEGENGIGGNNGKAGDTSPDSGSMISDDVPSGYNSGEHYDTLSAGYMSDMAGRITDTDTRRDWREPSLDVIEESRDNTGAGAAASTGGMSKKSSDEEEEDDDHERRDDGNGPCPPGREGEIDVGADRTRPLA